MLSFSPKTIMSLIIKDYNYCCYGYIYGCYHDIYVLANGNDVIMIVTMVIVAIEVIVAIVTQKLMFLVWIIWLHRFGDFCMSNWF